MKRLAALLVLMGLAWLAKGAAPGILEGGLGRTSLALGFLLLAAFLSGELIAPLRLPRITGYLMAGLIFGPQLLGLVDAGSLEELRVIDSLALTFIALSAGGELELSELRRNRRVIFFCLASLLIVVFVGTVSLFLVASPLFAFTRALPGAELVVIAALLGAIATARSPASAIAIIKESRAKGPFTEVALGLTVSMDILAIVLFAVVVSAGQFALGEQALDFGYILGLVAEISLSLIMGAGLGLALAAWLRRTDRNQLIEIFLLAIVVSELSHFSSEWLESSFELDFHLEPMLICIATGFVVRNFSEQGRRFLQVIERGGLMVYTLFFALAGASLDLEILRRAWSLALLLVLIRFGSIQLGAWLGSTLARADRVYKRNLGISFVTQAGVSIGLAKAVELRFPGWGVSVTTLAIASISINQIVGPILFKRALASAGEEGRSAVLAQETLPRPERDAHPAAGGLPVD